MTKILTPEDVAEHMTSGGIARYDAIRAHAEAHSQESATPPGRHLLRDAVGKLTQAVIDWIVSCGRGGGARHLSLKYLKMVDPKVTALITSEVILDRLTDPARPASSTAISIGRALEEEARFSLIAKERPNEWKDLVREASRKDGARARRVLRALARTIDSEWDEWGTRNRLVVGTVLVELFAASTGMIEVKNIRVPGRKRQQALIAPTEELLGWLEEAHERHRVSFPLYLPTVEPPEPWVSPHNGGYPSNVYMRWPLVRTTKAVRDRITLHECPEFYSAVNTVQDTGWCVNGDVFEVFDHLWAEGSQEAGLPPRESEDLPPKPPNIGEDERVLKEWKTAAAGVYTRNAKRVSKRLRTARVHATAALYRHQPFWYPHKADFRGRVYPVAQFLNPQGDDLSKGLLQFSEARPVNTPGARRWLAIHGANVWGNDKVSMDERVAWVEAHDAEIRSVGRDPIVSGMWSKADKPWQFLAWALDWSALRDAEEAGRIHYSQLPVAMDGSNNGLQLYSLLTRDESGAAATNVSPGPEPQDVYQDVADLVTEALKRDAESLDEDVRTLARDWLAFVDYRVPRGLTKRPVMVRPYGGTRQSCIEYLFTWYEDEVEERGLRHRLPFRHAFKHVVYLSVHVEEAIRQVVAKAEGVMDWLREVGRIASDAGKPVEWRSPCGFIVNQFRENQAAMSIKTRMGSRLISRWFRQNTGKPSKKRMMNGLPPNFVHSLDASVLVRTINACADQGIKSLAMVHDSYATHAADAEDLARILRESTVSIFSEDVLADFKAQVEKGLGVELPPLPAYGNLDPSSVLNSTYFFA